MLRQEIPRYERSACNRPGKPDAILYDGRAVQTNGRANLEAARYRARAPRLEAARYRARAPRHRRKAAAGRPEALECAVSKRDSRSVICARGKSPDRRYMHEFGISRAPLTGGGKTN